MTDCEHSDNLLEAVDVGDITLRQLGKLAEVPYVKRLLYEIEMAWGSENESRIGTIYVEHEEGNAVIKIPLRFPLTGFKITGDDFIA